MKKTLSLKLKVLSSYLITNNWVKIMNDNYKLYIHVNKINDKKYVGITKQKPKYRWRSDGSGYFRSPHFYNAIQKYGWDNFEHIILFDNLTYEKATELEKHYIKLYNTRDKKYGYNMTDGGEGSINVEVSEETRIKLSIAGKGRKASEETRQKMSKSLKGRKLTPKTIEKLRISHIGHKPNENQLRGLQIGWGSRKKEVYCIDDFGNRMDFNSITSASTYFNSSYLNKNFKNIATNHYKCCDRYWYYKEAI